MFVWCDVGVDTLVGCAVTADGRRTGFVTSVNLMLLRGNYTAQMLRYFIS
jgi:hypothetical protein